MDDFTFDPIQIEEEHVKEYRERSVDMGILKLMARLLETALEDIRDNRDIYHTRSWIMADDEDGHCFSFLAICENLDLDPAQIRRGVESYLAKRAQA